MKKHTLYWILGILAVLYFYGKSQQSTVTPYLGG